ncbi:MAG: flippase [Methanobacteriaceae archaeon]|nr:flippase [Methanobacteriaceae archaeon]
MNTVQKIAKNTILLSISQIITYALGFVFIMYSARYLGVEDFGILSFALAFSGIMMLFADLGLSTLMIREVSRDKNLTEKYIKNILSLKIILLSFTLLSSFIIILIMGYNIEIIKITVLITLYSLFSSLSIMFYSLFQAHEKLEYQSLGQVLNQSLLLLGAFFLIFNKIDIMGFALLYFIVGLIVFSYNFTVCRCRYVLPKMEIDLDFWKKLIKKALPLSILIIFSSIAFRIDIVLLSMLDSNTAVGIYSAAYRLIEILIFLPTVFVASIYPVVSRFHVSSQESLKKAYKTSFKYLTFLGLPIATGVTLLADKIILLIYGSQFAGSVIALKILIWAIPLIFLTYFSGTIVISINKQNIAVKIFLLSMIINVVLNTIFIPYFSFYAASIITIITELTELSLFSFFLFKLICNVQIKKIIIKPIIASLVMGLFIFYMDMNLYLQIFTATCIYFFTLLILKTFSDEDFDLIRQVITLKKK